MSERLYQLLLKLYPDHFRQRYGDEALRLVRDRARCEKGFLAGLRLWADLLLDLATSLPREYSNAPAPTVATTQTGPFQLLDERSPNPSLLCLGGALSAFLFLACNYAVIHSRPAPASFRAPVSLQGSVENDPDAARDPYLEKSSILLRAGKSRAFGAISIRRHRAESGPSQAGPTADGFRSIGLPMVGIFRWAYALPNQSLIGGAPGWLSGELYDVEAKVGGADLAEWQKPEMRQTMLRAMLRAMLAERCGAVVHYGTAALVIDRVERPYEN